MSVTKACSRAPPCCMLPRKDNQRIVLCVPGYSMEISSFSTTAHTDFSMGALCSEHCKYRSNNSHVTSNVQKLTGDSLLGEEAHDLWQSVYTVQVRCEGGGSFYYWWILITSNLYIPTWSKSFKNESILYTGCHMTIITSIFKVLWTKSLISWYFHLSKHNTILYVYPHWILSIEAFGKHKET